jgi:streptomycin 6-kinase
VIPPLLVRNVGEYWPELSDSWLAALPTLIDDITADWGLRLAEPHRMTIHWVSSVVRRDGARGVLKLGVPDGHLDAEAEALRIFDGNGAARLLKADPKRGAMLLEEIFPGTPVSELEDDEEATAVLIETARRLHRVPPEDCTLPHLSSLSGSFLKYRDNGLVPQRMVDRAAGLFAELCASATAEVVLHGDLHHDNVLASDGGLGGGAGDRQRHSGAGSETEWFAIDPHGFVGDPGYDGAAMLYNPDPENRDPALLHLVPRRIEQLAEHDDLDRVVAWAYVMGVLAQMWAGDNPGRALDVANLLESRLP